MVLFPTEQIEGEIHLVSGSGTTGIAMTREFLGIPLGKADESGVFDNNAAEQTAKCRSVCC